MKFSVFADDKNIESFISPPKPAKNYIPDWYKKINFANKNNIVLKDNFIPENKTVKNCMPFLDSLTHGYIQETWTDIYIESISEKEIKYFWSDGPEIMSSREKSDLTIGKEFYNFEFIWRSYWSTKLPKGYSALFTHPLNRVDLPFFTMSGIIDCDSFYHSTVSNMPFYIKKGFTGIIPAGTPMYQIIPIKRENWKKNETFYEDMEKKFLNHTVDKRFINSYRSIFWKKKKFE
jgi:hypothetical protein